VIFENEENGQLLNLKHILHVIQERVYLYKKRSLETKRAMKAYHRASIIPDSFRIQIMIEAEIAHIVYFIAEQSLVSFIENFSSKSEVKTTNLNTNFKNVLQEEFLAQMNKMDTIFSHLGNYNYSLLSKIPYTLHDDYQREIIAQYILAHTKELVSIIFKDIAIFDDVYAKKIIYNLKLFLSEKYSSL